MKKIIITSGGTREYIDDVRVLTNISTGKLGSVIAETLCNKDTLVYYIYAEGSVLPTIPNQLSEYIVLVKIKDTKDLMRKLSKLVPVSDIIIHCMAVSDFSFDRKKAIKLKSDDKEEFIRFLGENIKKNPKVISKIKEWNPDITLVGFKFEVGLTHKKLIDVASQSLLKNKADFVVANDKKEMQEQKEHIAYIVDSTGKKTKCRGKQDIAQKLKSCLSV
jgi:phosphopantothenate-cysteine ligase